MSKRNKYSRLSWSDIFDYLEGKLKGRERNAIEREMERDPFEAEAMEGFEKVSREEAEQDLSQLRASLSRRTRKIRWVGWYSAAAALATILVAGTIFLHLNNDDGGIEKFEGMPEMRESGKVKELSEGEQLSEGEELSEVEQLSEVEELSEVDEQNRVTEQPGLSEENGESFEGDGAVDEEVVELAEDAELAEEVVEAAKEFELKSKEIDPDETNAEVQAGQIDGVPEVNLADEAMSMADKGTNEAERGVIKTDKGLGEADKGTSVADNNIIIETKEYAAAAPVLPQPMSSKSAQRASKLRKRELNDTEAASYKNQSNEQAIHPAHPANGYAAYFEYLDSSLVFPPDEKNIDSADVYVNFLVDTTGRPGDFNILRSPGEAFSKEALRAIKEGPDWNPAGRDGEQIESSTTLWVVFKKKPHK